jgi:hypothetical protein
MKEMRIAASFYAAVIFCSAIPAFCRKVPLLPQNVLAARKPRLAVLNFVTVPQITLTSVLNRNVAALQEGTSLFPKANTSL